MRQAAIEGVLEIYQDESDRDLDHFSERFKKRFIQMTTDAHDAVPGPAAQVCICLAK